MARCSIGSPLVAATRDGGDLWEILARLDHDGCARYVVTEVSRDGTLRGPNMELYREVTRATTSPRPGGLARVKPRVDGHDYPDARLSGRTRAPPALGRAGTLRSMPLGHNPTGRATHAG